MLERTAQLSDAIEDVAIEKVDCRIYTNLNIGDFFCYFAGRDADRAVICRVINYVDCFPFEDSWDEEYITLPIVDVWVEVGVPPAAEFRKVQAPAGLLFEPEYRDQLDVFDRIYFSQCAEGSTLLTEEDANIISTINYGQSLYIIRENASSKLADCLAEALPLAPYHE